MLRDILTRKKFQEIKAYLQEFWLGWSQTTRSSRRHSVLWLVKSLGQLQKHLQHSACQVTCNYVGHCGGHAYKGWVESMLTCDIIADMLVLAMVWSTWLSKWKLCDNNAWLQLCHKSGNGHDTGMPHYAHMRISSFLCEVRGMYVRVHTCTWWLASNTDMLHIYPLWQTLICATKIPVYCRNQEVCGAVLRMFTQAHVVSKHSISALVIKYAHIHASHAYIERVSTIWLTSCVHVHYLIYICIYRIGTRDWSDKGN